LDYPVKLTPLPEGFLLYLPDPEQVKPVYEASLEKDPATAFPFWAQIWPSALALSLFLKEEQGLIKGKELLELGAGIGLPSFAAADIASKVTISDHAPEAVALIKKNIQYLGLRNVKALLLDWNHLPEEVVAEIVLLSDVNYAPGQFDALLTLIQKFTEQGSTIILATPQRITITPFAEVLQPYIRQSVLKTVAGLHQDVEIRILVLSL
jgi:predicted nicotinamide N-methyase